MIDGHGDDSYKYKHIISNFSSNVYNHLNQEGLVEHLSGCMELIRSYPEPQPYSLERDLAAFYHVSPESVCVTNGATEAIYLIAQAYRESHSAVLMPTFSEYADACRLHAHHIHAFYSADKLPDEASLVWICNPNNPTGEVRCIHTLRKQIAGRPDCLFVIDQSYEAFTDKELLGVREVAEMSNVLLLHSMTKCFAVPGLRLGFVTGNSLLLRRIRAHRMPWSVNALAIEAGRYLLRHSEEYELDTTALLAERKRVADGLVALGGIDVWPSDTHYMLVRLRSGRAEALKDYLAEQHGILIRDASNFEGLDEHFFRIAVQTPEENNRLINSVKEWIYAY